MKKFTFSFFASACILLCCYKGNTQTPFPANTNVALVKPGMNTAAKNYTIYTNTDASGSIFTPVITFTPSTDINGIGINPTDNLLYGASYVGDNNDQSTLTNVGLFRIGMDGTTVNLGILPVTGQSGSGSLEFVNFSAGMVSSEGAYYYLTYAVKPNAVNRIFMRIAMGLQPDLTASDLEAYLCWINNVSSLAAIPSGDTTSVPGGLSGYYKLDFSNADVTSSINAFLSEVNADYPNIFDADGGIQDIAINPVDTKPYGYITYPGDNNEVLGRPIVFNTPDPATNTSGITPVGTTENNQPGHEVAGLQFDASGNFYGLFITGDYAQIDLTTGALLNLTPSNITTSNGNLRGDLAQANTNIPFPIKLVDFTGKATDEGNVLTWSTAMEENNKMFEIQRSEDAQKWTGAGTVNSKAENGNSTSLTDYTFTDNKPNPVNNYYRLKQIDRDGGITYSKVIQITSYTSQEKLRLYPNPARSYINIDGLHKGSKLSVLDQSGKSILTITSTQTSETINLGHLPAGTYYVIINYMNGQQCIQFVK